MGDFQNDPWPGPTGTGSEPVSPARSLKKKFREAPPVYFMPRYSMPVTVAKYSALAFAGLGIGMVIEGWIKRKVQEDGGYIELRPKPKEPPATG